MSARASRSLIADASRTLTSSLDYDATLRQVALLPIPRLADWSMVFVPHDGDARVGRMVVAHRQSTVQRRLQTIWNRVPLELPKKHPLADCLRTRTPVALAECSASTLNDLIWQPADAEVVQKVGLRSIMAVPLVAHGVLLGGMMLVGARPSRPPYAATELEPMLALARCYAQAIYNAQLFWEASLAVQVRTELVNAASRGLLEIVAEIRARTVTLERTSLLTDAGIRQRRRKRAVFEIELLLGQMQRLIGDLRAVSDPGAWL